MKQPKPFMRRLGDSLKALFVRKPSVAKPLPVEPRKPERIDFSCGLPESVRIARHLCRVPTRRKMLARRYGLPTPPRVARTDGHREEAILERWVARCRMAQGRRA